MAGSSPSHQEGCSKPPYQLQPQGGQTSEAREATTLLSAKRRPYKNTIQNEKAEDYDSNKGTRKKTPEKQISDLEISNLYEIDFRLIILKISQDLGNKLVAKKKLQKNTNTWRRNNQWITEEKSKRKLKNT